MSIDYQAARRQMLEWIRVDSGSKRLLGEEGELQPGDYEIYGEKLNSMLAEAREVFMKTGVSALLHAGDFAVGICTPRGDLVASSAGVYFFAVLCQLPVKYIVHYFRDDPSVGVREGDIFYTNEAILGGLHNPDQFAIMPVFHEGELVAWTLAGVHQPETGAVEPGGQPVSARSRYDEGMRLSPIKIGEHYRIRRDLLDMMTNFVSRSPVSQEIDVRARCSAADRLRVRLQQLLESKGTRFLHRLFREMLRQAETGARNKIRPWRDGVYRSVSFIDTVGHSEGLTRVSLAMEKKGDELHFDLTGTSPENDGSLQAFAHATWACAATYLFSFPFQDLPPCIGTYEPIHFRVPDGTLLNPGADAAVANAPHIGRLVVNAVHSVFARMLYASGECDLCSASHGGSGCTVAFSGPNQWGALASDLMAFKQNTEGAGARVDLDGVDAYGFFWANQGRAPDVEDFESRYTFLHLSQKYRVDSCGFGKRRGGSGTYSAWMNYHVPEITALTLGNCSRIPVGGGLFGGYAANVVGNLLVRGTEFPAPGVPGQDGLPADLEGLVRRKAGGGERELRAAQNPPVALRRGDVIVGMNTGGHGCGDVLERDPEQVLEDFRAGIISARTVETIYCVVVEARTGKVDRAATEERRHREREDRKARGVPYREFESSWSRKRPPAAILCYFGRWPDGIAETKVKRS